MELDNEKQPIDRWLDAAIKEYGSTEPDTGLDQRVLRNLTAKSVRGTGWSKWWALAAIAAVVLLVAGVLLIKSRHEPQRIAVIPNQQINAIEPPQTPAEKMTIRDRAPHKKAHPSAMKEVAVQAWPIQFPTPQPLSTQEQLLAQYVREQPKQAQLVAHARAKLLQENLAGFEQRDPKEKIEPVFE